jgi:hypothetical protein
MRAERAGDTSALTASSTSDRGGAARRRIRSPCGVTVEVLANNLLIESGAVDEKDPPITGSRPGGPTTRPPSRRRPEASPPKKSKMRLSAPGRTRRPDEAVGLRRDRDGVVSTTGARAHLPGPGSNARQASHARRARWEVRSNPKNNSDSGNQAVANESAGGMLAARRAHGPHLERDLTA